MKMTTTTAQAIREPIAIPTVIWVGLPLAMLIAVFGGRLAGDAFYRRWIYGELALVELSTVLFALSAAALAIACWRQRAALPQPWLSWWLLVFAVGALYFGGEEASWGQHLLGWSTPESIARLNDHGETNLHNITNWADEKPKQLVDLASLIGGVIIPLFIWFRGIRLDRRRALYWFLPTIEVLPACLLAVLLKNFERLRDLLDWYPEGILDSNMRMSEPQEMYFSLFFLFYTWSLYLRLKRTKGA